MIDGYLVQTPNLIFFCDVKRYLFVLEKEGRRLPERFRDIWGISRHCDEIVGLVNRVYNGDMETFIDRKTIYSFVRLVAS